MLNFAIIGCGNIASRHARHSASTGKLLAVCDIIKEKAGGLAKQYGAKAYGSVEDLLQNETELDVVAICTPNGLHAQHTIQALKAGFHVICEKPMAIKKEDGEQMISEAAKAGKQLFIVKQNRFNAPVMEVKRLLDEGKLGSVYSVQLNCCWNRDAGYYKDSWHGTPDMDGGILYTQFSHFIDLLYWMIGDVKEVLAYTANFSHKELVDFEDAGVACLRFENGALGAIHFTINGYRKNIEGSIMLVAERGTVRIGGQYLNRLEYMDVEGEVINDLPIGGLPNDYGTYQGSMSNHDKIYAHVDDVISRNYPNQFRGYEGLKTIQIIEKIYKAAKWTR